MCHQLQFADWVSVALPRVFDFFADPRNLPRLMPPATGTRIDRLRLVPPPPSPDQNASSTKQPAGPGTIIETSFRPFPFLSLRQKWTAAITEFEWNHHFVDAQQKGPFKLWHHRHEFLQDERNGFMGTLVRDLIEYEVGFGPLGALANLLFIERRMRAIFAYRQKILPQLL